MANPYAPPRAAVLDLADPAAAASAAGRGTRLGAAVLDGIIAMAMIYAPFLIGAVIGSAAGRAGGNDGASAVIVVGLVLTLVGLVAWSWITFVYVKRNGQSIAKKLLGIKVIRSDGTPASVGRIFWLRNVVNGLLSIIPLYGLIELLFIFGESRQCLHDKIADTIVVEA